MNDRYKTYLSALIGKLEKVAENPPLTEKIETEGMNYGAMGRRSREMLNARAKTPVYVDVSAQKPGEAATLGRALDPVSGTPYKAPVLFDTDSGTFRRAPGSTANVYETVRKYAPTQQELASYLSRDTEGNTTPTTAEIGMFRDRMNYYDAYEARHRPPVVVSPSVPPGRARPGRRPAPAPVAPPTSRAAPTPAPVAPPVTPTARAAPAPAPPTAPTTRAAAPPVAPTARPATPTAPATPVRTPSSAPATPPETWFMTPEEDAEDEKKRKAAPATKKTSSDWLGTLNYLLENEAKHPLTVDKLASLLGEVISPEQELFENLSLRRVPARKLEKVAAPCSLISSDTLLEFQNQGWEEWAEKKQQTIDKTKV